MFSLDALCLTRGGRRLLSPLSMTISGGCLTAILGPNGAGKSTLLRLLSGEIRPTGGRILLDGVPLAAIPPRQLAMRRAMLAQSLPASFSFTLRELVQLGLEARSPAGAPGPHATAEAALAAVDLAGYAGRLIDSLSGGEQQRAHLARILAQIGAPTGPEGPRFLFLDEPIASLDIRHQMMVMALARDFADGGGGVVMVLHDLALACRFADRVLLIDRGELRADAAPEPLIASGLLPEVFGLPLRIERHASGSYYLLP